MRMIEFRNYDGVTVYIPINQIEFIRKPSGRVHDHGGLTTVRGLWIGFDSDSTADRILKEMQDEKE